MNIVLAIEIRLPSVYGTANFAGATRMKGIAGVESSQNSEPMA